MLSLTAAKALIKDEEYLEPVYNYWVKKHSRSCMNGLILTLKSEKKDASSPNDPYIAFRRRIEKMQTRKVMDMPGGNVPECIPPNSGQHIIKYKGASE